MRTFAQVDVFTARAGLGNPVAVVLDADGLPDDELARLAAWTNLSETTFVLPPTSPAAHYRVRIFTPGTELPFAGHPTLGTAQALIDAGRLPDLDGWVQECGAGLVQVRRDRSTGSLSFKAPDPAVTASLLSPEQLSALLGCPAPAGACLVDVGPRWLTARVSVSALADLVPDGTALLRALDPTWTDGVTLYAVDDNRRVHLRSFFDGGGVLIEDPVCGSGNAAVAAHLLHTGQLGDVPVPYEARQGSHRGRDGQITVTVADGSIWVGGPAVTVITGTIAV
jgi:PhzF family phenazine biosynthesis protein